MGKVAPVTPVTPPNGGGDGITDISLLQQILAELQGKNLSSQVFVLTCSSGTNYQAVYDGTSKGVGVRYVKKAIFQNLNSATSETLITGSKAAPNTLAGFSILKRRRIKPAAQSQSETGKTLSTFKTSIGTRTQQTTK